jgi:hypothetical protein
VIILAIGFSIWTKFKYRLANQKIHELVLKKTNGLYELHYENLSIDEVNGTLLVNHIQLFPDTSYYHEMLLSHSAPPVLIKLNIPAFLVTGVQTPRALLNKEIKARKIEMNRPSIEIEINNFMKDTSSYSPEKDIYKQLLGQLKNVQFDSLVITNANLLVKNIQTGKSKFIGRNVSLILTDLLIDSIQKDDSSRILFSKNLDLRCSEIALQSKDKKYNYRFEKLEFISQINRFSIGSISIIPEMSEEDFAKAYKFSKDRYHFKIDKISLLHIDRAGLWNKRIEADSLIIDNSTFKIYRDISHPHDSVDRTLNFPQQQLLRVPVPLYFKKVILTHTFIEYKEKNGKSDSSGKVQFTDATATLSNVTNMPSFIQKNNICKIEFKAKLLDQAPLTARLDLYLDNKKGKFFIRGNMGSMDGKGLNSIIEPMGLARIEKGNIKSLDFNLKGNNYADEGKLLFLYNDLQVSLLKKNEEKNQFNKKTIPTLVTNMLLKKANPSSNDQPRQTAVRYTRDIHRSIFHLLWKSIFSGIKQTAGINK